MKKVLFILVMFFTVSAGIAQNYGFGTNDPLARVHVSGSLLVTTPTKATSTAPTAVQTKLMINGSTITFVNADSTGRIYDPGGPSANYAAGITAFAAINGVAHCVGIEVTVESMQLGTGDSLIVKETSSSTVYFLAVGNGYTSTGKWIFNGTNLHLTFKSNANANVGSGFSLLFKRLYDNSAPLPDITGVAGTALFFDAKNGAFRTGRISTSPVGSYSTAMGFLTTASGLHSTAMGYSTTASGQSSTAFGERSTASGYNSTAMGTVSTASGSSSTAMGNSTTASGSNATAMGSIAIASGNNSTAIGSNATASGDNSIAIGTYVSTINKSGSFIIGDNSTYTAMYSSGDNNFRARFVGGYRFFTSSDYSTSAVLFSNDNAWSTTSDKYTKEKFEDVDGEDFLKKIAAMKLTTWNYKTQNPQKFRHYGPMAQDFYTAFGKDKYGTIGTDTTINSADFDGVNLIAIQALERRTAKQQGAADTIAKEMEELKAIILQLKKELEQLKLKKDLCEDLITVNAKPNQNKEAEHK